MSAKKSNATKAKLAAVKDEETCPSECVATNHPGIEHQAYLDLINGAAAELGEQPPYHAILKVWRNMLNPETQSRHRPPTPDWCAVLVAKWPFLRFAECGTVQVEYFKIFDDMHALIEQVAADNPEAFEIDTREDDIENKPLYVHLLTEFQKALFVTQAAWSFNDKDASAKMVALGEAQQQILGKDGLASYLGVVGLPFTQDEQDAMNQELNEFRASLEV